MGQSDQNVRQRQQVRDAAAMRRGVKQLQGKPVPVKIPDDPDRPQGFIDPNGQYNHTSRAW